MAAPTGLLKWLSEVKVEELAGTLGTVGGVLYIAWDRFSKLRSKNVVTAAYEASRPKSHPPPPPTPPAREPTGQHAVDAAEHQALQARYASTEATLLETQMRIGAVSATLSRHIREATREEAALSASLIMERAENERLRKENTELRAELMRRQAAP
jgi:hypothetical protein